MARIPDVSPMDAPRTPTFQQGPTLSFDLGTGAVGDTLQQYADQKAHDDARKAFDTGRSQFDASYQPAAESYDGKTPGFAAGQIAGYDQQMAAQRASLNPFARRAFDDVVAQNRVTTFEEASKLEGRASAQRQRTGQDQQSRLQSLSAVADVTQQYGAAKAPLVDAYDGSTPGFADHLISTFDGIAKQALDAAPEDARPHLALALANARIDAISQAQAVESGTRKAWEINTGLGAADTLANAVRSDPGSYQTSAKTLDGIVSRMPAAQQAKLAPELHDELAKARFQGMIASGQGGQAAQELNSGDYDGVLHPETKNALLHTIEATADAAARSAAGATMDLRMKSEIDSVATTGVSTGLTSDMVAAAKTPGDAIKFTADLDKAKAAYLVVKGMTALPAADRATRLMSLKPQGGDPDFAIREQIYEAAQRADQQAQALQTSDPAKAAQQDPNVQTLWRLSQSTDPAAARTPASARFQSYAQAALTLQAHMGIDPNSARLLPVDVAKSMIRPLIAAKGAETVQPMEALAAQVNSYGPYAGQVLKELGAAGLRPEAQAVLVLGGSDPVAIAQYAHGLEAGATLKLDKTQKDKLTSLSGERLKALTASLMPATGGPALAQKLEAAVEISARGFMANGATAEEAVKQAVAPYMGQYVFDHAGWRIPAAVANRQVPIATTVTRRVFGDQQQSTGTHGVSAQSLARTGAALEFQDMLAAKAPGGAQGAADAAISGIPFVGSAIGAYRMVTGAIKPFSGKGLADIGDGATADDRRAAYADTVHNSARWATSQDDTGLVLVYPGRSGGWQPVMGADGKPVSRTWDQLVARGKRGR